MGKKVTAIIPTRNRAQRLEQAVRSAMDQTHDEIEIVVVDGGSTDDTPRIVEKLDKESTVEITYIRNESPHGLPAARNQAAEHTHSDYLAFLDDDDEWHPEKVEKQLTVFEKKPERVGVVHTGFRSETPDGKHLHTKRPIHGREIFEDLLVRNVIGPPSTVMVRREAFDEVDGFDEQLRHQEDWDFYLRLAREFEFAYVADPLVIRLVHEETMSADVATQKEYREQILDRYEEELVKRDLKSVARAAHHRKAGITFCRNGESARGRDEFGRSLQSEWHLSTGILYCSTLFGEVGFNLLAQSKRLIVTTLNEIRTERI